MNNSMPLGNRSRNALASLGTAPPAAAAALGEVAAPPRWGELCAEIRLPDGKPADAECFRVVPPPVESFRPCARAVSPSAAAVPKRRLVGGTPPASTNRC